jgi:two-component sensor histidine kinase
MLAAQVVPDAPGQDIFEVVNQLDRATDLIDDPAERERLAYFNLLAGERAKAANAYVSALSYFAAGCALRGSDTWERDYRLSFALERNLAECEFLTGQTEQAKWRLAELSLRAQTLVDRAAVAWLQVTLFTAQGRSDLAVDLCIGFLRDVGIDWPVHPDRDQARAEYNALLAQIGDRPIHALIDLPLLTDEDRRATLDVLTAVLPPAFFSDEHLVCLVLCRMANLSLLHGNSDASSLAYAYLGMVVGPSFGDYEAGFSFGKLGLALVDERGIDRFKARVYMCFSYHVTPWIRHIRTSLPLLRRAFDAASESGDLTYMGFSSCTLITSLLAAGEPLDIVQREAQERLEVVRAGRFGLIVDIITGQLQMIRCLRGDSTEPGAAFDEAAFERHLESDNGLAIANCWHWIRKLQRSYVNGDTALAMTAISRVAPLLWTSSGHFEMAEYHFYAALARARAHDTASPEQRIELIAELAAHAAQLALWAGHCPANFVSRLSLVAGEMARIRGANFEAMQHYEMAIRASREQGFAQNDALANELAASFYEARGFHATAKIYLRDARHAYLRWGATAKAEELERCHPDLREESSQPNATQAQQIDRLDLAAIVRTSQAISGEVVLAKMIRTLMSVVLEYAGAQRGVLVLPRGEALWIAAEANTAREALNVRIEDREVGPMDLPASMLYYGIRTQQCVRLDDALVSNQFSEDEYVRATQPRSVLCLPLVKQTRLTGVLYLENSLAPGVFTPSRVEALQLLASQAAISLENASLQQTAALLEEKEALLKEVHHRVKNNLQLISSLLSLQAARVRDPEVAELFTDSRNRVRSMALVHENLYRAGNFARIPMASHVEHLCGHLARAYDMHRQNVHLCIEVDDVQLDMSRAISCGLVINELVSNALKHAFPHGRGGSLRVTLKQYGEGACILGVADDGIGLSDGFSVARTGSLGLQLIEDLTQQLLGKLEIRGGENGGTDVTVAFQSCHPRS